MNEVATATAAGAPVEPDISTPEKCGESLLLALRHLRSVVPAANQATTSTILMRRRVCVTAHCGWPLT